MSTLVLKVVMAATSDDMVEIAGKRRGCMVTTMAEQLDGWCQGHSTLLLST